MKTDNARISDWVWSQPISPTGKLICLALLRYRNNATGLCYPSHATLCAATGLSRSGLQRSLRELRRSGIVEAQDAPGRSNRYALHTGKGCSRGEHKPILIQCVDAQDRGLERVTLSGEQF